MGSGRLFVGNFEGLDYCDGIFLYFYMFILVNVVLLLLGVIINLMRILVVFEIFLECWIE